MTQGPDRDILAGEYVLGLLDGLSKEDFERGVAGDAELDAAVARWQARLAPLDATAPSVEPSKGLWQRIEGGLDGAKAPRPVSVSPAAPGSRFAQWWNDMRLWRGAAFAGAAVAVLLAIGFVAALERARRQPVMVAVLLTDTNSAAAVVNTFADGRVELLPLQDIPVPQGRALEIWTLWDRAAGPRSVGLIDRARAVSLRLENLPLGTDQLFEITVEPAAGSPTGRPTGPIVAKGLTARRL